MKHRTDKTAKRGAPKKETVKKTRYMKPILILKRHYQIWINQVWV